MLRKVLGVTLLATVCVVVTTVVESGLGVRGIFAAGRPQPHQTTTQTCTSGPYHQGVIGTVTGVNGNTLTVKAPDGSTVNVTVSSSTTYRKEGGSASLSDIHTGSQIAVRGTKSGNTVTATEVEVISPHAGGQVTAIAGNTITVSPPSGAIGKMTNVTRIVTTGSTQYFTPGTGTANASAVKVGSWIMATGTLSADGKTLTATHVMIAPAGFAPGSTPHMGFSRPWFHGNFSGGWTMRGDWTAPPSAGSSAPVAGTSTDFPSA